MRVRHPPAAPCAQLLITSLLQTEAFTKETGLIPLLGPYVAGRPGVSLFHLIHCFVNLLLQFLTQGNKKYYYYGHAYKVFHDLYSISTKIVTRVTAGTVR
jgi:hypothetical protein